MCVSLEKDPVSSFVVEAVEGGVECSGEEVVRSGASSARASDNEVKPYLLRQQQLSKTTKRVL